MQTLLPTLTRPVSTRPCTAGAVPPPLQMSLIDKRNGLLIGRSGDLNVSAKNTKFRILIEQLVIKQFQKMP